MSWKSETLELFREYKVLDEITEVIRNKYFPELTHEKVKHNKVRAYLRPTQIYKDRIAERNALRLNTVSCHGADEATHEDSSVVGVIGDTHLPFVHPNYIHFLKDTFKKYGVNQVVHIGDLADHHAMSRFQTETCARGAVDELDLSIETLKEYAKAFPKVRLCFGNHDEIPKRQAATVNIDERYLKTLHDVLELPKEWTFEDEFIIDNVLYKHGTGCGGGKTPYLNTAMKERLSVVIGHYHSKAGCIPMANKRDLIFGLGVGCGIDIQAYSFAYGRHNLDRPVLGCGIVFSATDAIFAPMNDRYFRN